MNTSPAAPVLQVFTRVPRAGRVKTRLVPRLGAHGAMQLHRLLAERALAAATEAAQAAGAARQLWFDGDAGDPWLLAARARDGALGVCPQVGGDLGERMHAALEAGCSTGQGAVLFGTDCPGLDAACLGQAIDALATGADLVLGPVEDGGYVLIGLRRPCAALFRGVPWSTDAVLATTLAIAGTEGLVTRLLPVRWDVDRPADLERLRSLGPPFVGLLDALMGEGTTTRRGDAGLD